MARLQSYEKLLAEVGHLSRRTFLDRVRDPHLFLDSGDEVDLRGLFRTVQFVTGKPSGDTPVDDTPVGAFAPAAFARQIRRQWVMPVSKAGESNAFSMMVTLGRAGNNDLALPDRLVSKFHCYFRRIHRAWTLTDANSTNGTVVDGERLQPERMVPLRSGASIEVGSLRLLFLEPADLYDLMQYSRSLVAGEGWSPGGVSQSEPLVAPR
jgi:hypothetical protein